MMLRRRIIVGLLNHGFQGMYPSSMNRKTIADSTTVEDAQSIVFYCDDCLYMQTNGEVGREEPDIYKKEQSME